MLLERRRHALDRRPVFAHQSPHQDTHLAREPSAINAARRDVLARMIKIGMPELSR